MNTVTHHTARRARRISKMTTVAAPALPHKRDVNVVSLLPTLMLLCVFLPNMLTVYGSEERAPRSIVARQASPKSGLAPLPGWVGGFQGFCVNCQGQDVNSGQIVVVADRSVSVADCLAACIATPGLTACEMTHYAHTNFAGAGCYAHTNPTICRGSGSPYHYCWLMSASPTTSAPTSTPTSVPTLAPTSAPTLAPTPTPTSAPTTTPTATPTAAPTATPSLAPTMTPACNGVPDPDVCPSLSQHCDAIAASCPGTCFACTSPPTISPTQNVTSSTVAITTPITVSTVRADGSSSAATTSASPVAASPTSLSTAGHASGSIDNESSGNGKLTAGGIGAAVGIVLTFLVAVAVYRLRNRHRQQRPPETSHRATSNPVYDHGVCNSTTSDTDPDSFQSVYKTTTPSAPLGDSYIAVAGDSENYDGFDPAVSDTVGAANGTTPGPYESLQRDSTYAAPTLAAHSTGYSHLNRDGPG